MNNFFSDKMLLGTAYNKGINGISKDVYELFDQLIKEKEEQECIITHRTCQSVI